jgi:hypothetical protein
MIALRRMLLLFLSCLTVTIANPLQAAEKGAPQWLWRTKQAGANETIYFRKSFEIDLVTKVKSASLIGSCDNIFTLFINGKHVLQHNEWQLPVRADIAAQLQPGKNVFGIRAINEGAQAGFVAQILIQFDDGTKQTIVTDPSWLVSEDGPEGWQKIDFDDKTWTKPHVIGALGIAPWGLANWKAPSGMTQTAAGEATPEGCREAGSVSLPTRKGG